MRLLMFDIDGTLIRSHGVGRTAMAQAIEEISGLSDPLAEVALGGRTDPLILEEAYRLAGRSLDGAAPIIFARYIELLEEGLRDAVGFEVLPGVERLLTDLAALPDVALALGTGNIEPGARLKLGRGGLNDFFATGGFGSDARDRVDVLRAGVSKSERHYGVTFDAIWVVGDTPRDIQAAHAAGLSVLAVATGGYGADTLGSHGADAVVDDLTASAAIERFVQSLREPIQGRRSPRPR